MGQQVYEMKIKSMQRQQMIEELSQRSINDTSLTNNKYYQFYDQDDAREFEEFLRQKSKKMGGEEEDDLEIV